MSTTEDPAELEALLEYLKRTRAFDFTGYKRQSLTRRIQKRMQDAGVGDYAAYAALVERDAEELARLLDTVLINVTGFFRDDDPWDFLAAEVVPRILAERPPREPLRVWCAGCATGEEAYSLAMVFAEALGVDAFRDRVKVYATDADEQALAHARAAVFEPRALDGVPASYLAKYFEVVDGRHAFRQDLRRCVIFGRNDLIQDAPISRIDLLACRNTLMYFDAATQARIVTRFHFALADGGFLFLGRAETLLAHASLFAPVDYKRRMFRKIPSTRPRPHPAVTIEREEGRRGPATGGLSEAALDAAPTAQLVVDRRNRLVAASARARALFQLDRSDVGRPLQDLDVSYRPLDLRTPIDRVHTERRATTVGGVVMRTPAGAEQWFTVDFTPLYADNDELAGVTIAFTEVTAERRLEASLGDAIEQLRAAVEDRQSADEELETMNEELQSANSELNAINDELRRQSDELNQVSSFFESMLRSLPGAVIAVDRALRVLMWSGEAREMWGVRQEEAMGRSIFDIDFGLPIAPVTAAIQRCLAGGLPEPVRGPATNRRGKPITCEVTCTALIGPDAQIEGALLVMSEAAVPRDQPHVG